MTLLRDPSVAEPLLGHRESAVRISGLILMAALDEDADVHMDSPSVQGVLSCVRDAIPDVRMAAANAIANPVIGPLSTSKIADLSTWFTDDTSDERWAKAAKQALISIGSSAAAMMIYCVEHPREIVVKAGARPENEVRERVPVVRARAANVLGIVGGRAAVNTLGPFLLDPDAGARRAVAAALVRIQKRGIDGGQAYAELNSEIDKLIAVLRLGYGDCLAYVQLILTRMSGSAINALTAATRAEEVSLKIRAALIIRRIALECREAARGATRTLVGTVDTVGPTAGSNAAAAFALALGAMGAEAGTTARDRIETLVESGDARFRDLFAVCAAAIRYDRPQSVKLLSGVQLL